MSNRQFLLFLFVYSAITLGANLGAFEADLMEARNFVTAREMLTDGHWWETTMNGLPRLEKPPLPTWLTAIFGSVSSNFPLWLLRLPAMIMGILLVFWTYLLGKSLFEDEDKARWSACVAASSMLIIQMARTGSWDIYFVSFAIGSFVYLHRGLKKDEHAMSNFALGGLLLGCSVLSKGPVAIIMLVGFGGGLLLMEGYQAFLNRWKEILLASVIVGIVGFSWLIYNYIFQAEAAQFVIDKESVTWTTKHVKPFYFYLIYPVYSGIWAISAVLSLIPNIAKRQIGRSYWMLLIWIGITLLFFSLLPMKKERYLLPVIPVVALMVGAFLSALLNSNAISFTKRIFWVAFGIVGLLFSLSPLALIVIFNEHAFAVDVFTWIGTSLMFVCGITMIWSLWKAHFKRTVLAAGIGVAIINAFLLNTGEELFYKHADYVSPSRLMQNTELQNRDIYGNDPADMRVVYMIGQKILPIVDGLELAKQEEIAVIIGSPPELFYKSYADYNIQFLDSSDHHKRSHDAKLYAYLMQLK